MSGYRCTCSPLGRACPTPDECDRYAAPASSPAAEPSPCIDHRCEGVQECPRCGGPAACAYDTCGCAPAVPAAGAVDEAGLREALAEASHVGRTTALARNVRGDWNIHLSVADEALAALAPLLRELADTRAKVAEVRKLVDDYPLGTDVPVYRLGRALDASAPAATHTTSEETDR